MIYTNYPHLKKYLELHTELEMKSYELQAAGFYFKKNNLRVASYF